MFKSWLEKEGWNCVYFFGKFVIHLGVTVEWERKAKVVLL